MSETKRTTDLPLTSDVLYERLVSLGYIAPGSLVDSISIFADAGGDLVRMNICIIPDTRVLEALG